MDDYDTCGDDDDYFIIQGDFFLTGFAPKISVEDGKIPTKKSESVFFDRDFAILDTNFRGETSWKSDPVCSIWQGW